MDSDILIVGGGAAGLAAALSAAKTNPRLKVSVLEAQPRSGKKLLATGNGRCNLMNERAEKEDYAGDADFIAPALSLYKREYGRFWDELGLLLSTEDEGRVYPGVNQASAVLDALRLNLREKGVSEITDFAAAQIEKRRDGFTVYSEGRALSCRRVILATGGKAGKGLGENDSFTRLLSPFGHRVTRVYPALTCLKTDRQLLSGLKGIRLRGEICLCRNDEVLKREKGEILFQDDALSGIASMQLSLVASPLISRGEKLHALLSPLGERAENIIKGRISAHPTRSAQELLTGAVNRLIALSALKRAGISPVQRAESFTPSQTEALIRELRSWRVPLAGTGGFSQAQVMLGGLDTRDFDGETMRSRRVQGLLAAGEMLDVTGPCGGYNLEWAWASGMLAGKTAAEELK